MQSASKDDTVQSLRNSAQKLKNEAASSANDVKGDLRETANRAGQRVRHFIDNAAEEFSSASDSVSTRINEKPVQSVLIALGIGFVIGNILRRI